MFIKFILNTEYYYGNTTIEKEKTEWVSKWKTSMRQSIHLMKSTKH